MSAQPQIVLLILVFNWISSIYFRGDCRVFVKRFGNCDENEHYKVKVNVTFKAVGNKQYVDGSFVLTDPVDNHIKSNSSIEMLVGKDYVYLFSINEKKSCDALNKYFGEFWYDIERNAQLIPGLCPIPKGRYHIHNLLIDLDKMTTIQNFPIGSLRFFCAAYDNKNSLFTCLTAETETRL